MTDPNPSYAALRSLVAINQAAVVRALRELGYTVTEPPAAKLPAPTTLTWEHDTDEQGRTCERTTDRRARILCEVVNGEQCWRVCVYGTWSNWFYPTRGQARNYAQQLVRAHEEAFPHG